MAVSADLGRHLEDVLDTLVASGRYNSKSEVLREGVRLVEEREQRLRAIDQALAIGLSDVEAGRLIAAPELFAELRARYADEAA